MRLLRRALYALAVVPIVAGSVTVLAGSSAIPAAGDPAPNVESELRFYSVWWIGAGLALVWLASGIEHRGRELRVLCALLFLSGLSRVLAALYAGWPDPQFIGLMVLELVVPPVLVGCHAAAVSRLGRAA